MGRHEQAWLLTDDDYTEQLLAAIIETRYSAVCGSGFMNELSVL